MSLGFSRRAHVNVNTAVDSDSELAVTCFDDSPEANFFFRCSVLTRPPTVTA